MSRTFNSRKKMEARQRMLEAEAEKQKKEEELKEKELEKYWAIGAKVPGRKEREDEKRIMKENRKQELKELYEKEMNG